MLRVPGEAPHFFVLNVSFSCLHHTLDSIAVSLDSIFHPVTAVSPPANCPVVPLLPSSVLFYFPAHGAALLTS